VVMIRAGMELGKRGRSGVYTMVDLTADQQNKQKINKPRRGWLKCHHITTVKIIIIFNLLVCE
jgi:hypothetical protein